MRRSLVISLLIFAASGATSWLLLAPRPSPAPASPPAARTPPPSTDGLQAAEKDLALAEEALRQSEEELKAKSRSLRDTAAVLNGLLRRLRPRGDPSHPTPWLLQSVLEMEASATAVLLAAEESLNSGATETLEKALAQSETEFDRAQRIFQSLAPEGEGARAAEGRRLFNQAASLAREVVKLFEVRKPAEGEFAKRRAELVPRVKAELEKMSKPAESALPGPAPAPPPDRRPLLAALVLAAGVCLSGAAGFLAVRGAAAPLKPLREALRAAAQGNLSVRAESTGSDELGDMSRCFNQLMDERRRLEEGLKSRAATPPAEEKPAPPPPPTQVRLPADTKHLVERFLENRRTDANLIAKALVVQDFGAAYGFSHNMKATAESLGFPAVAELAAKMELAAERGDERTASGLLKALNLYLDQVEVIYE